MKQIRNIFSVIFATALGLSSCTPDFDAPKPDDSKLPEATNTIAEVKTMFMRPKWLVTNNDTILVNGKPRYKDLFTVYNMDTTKTITMNGIVISTDRGGNTYKKMVIRDPKDGSTIDISVDVSGISASYPYGQPVQVTCNRLQIGKYADLPVIGSTYVNSTKSGRVEVGRMNWIICQEYIKPYGMPNQELAKPIDATIPEILNGGTKYYSQLVTIKNVQFGAYYKSNGTSLDFFPSATFKLVKAGDEIPFSETNDLNVPVSRGIQDANGNIIPVTTSSYANFASKFLPVGKYNVTAIVGWYRDNADREGNFQMSVQEFKDIVPVN
ncbi:MAG: DUF5689 domain-containing protein [Bacteroidales bacterium]